MMNMMVGAAAVVGARETQAAVGLEGFIPVIDEKGKTWLKAIDLPLHLEPSELSDELRDLAGRLGEASAALKAACVPYAEAARLLRIWDKTHPEPSYTNQRLYRKWSKFYNKKCAEVGYHDALHAVCDAQKSMEQVQKALSAYRSRDLNELAHKACLVIAYEDPEQYGSPHILWRESIIATGVAFDAMRLLCMPKAQA